MDRATASKKLYLVQVLHQKYQDRPDYKKLHAVTTAQIETGNLPPLDYYCRRLNVDRSNAIYVYASENVPSN